MKNRKSFFITALLFALFAVHTTAVLSVDVQPIGPGGTSVGLATVNQFVFEHTGVNMVWYTVTDWLGLAAIAVALGFALLGLVQSVCRRSPLKVDRQLLLLGALYVMLAGAYVFFEINIVNCRPVLLGPSPEASYPSSHTMLVTCIMATAMMEFRRLFAGCRRLRLVLNGGCILIAAATIVGRTICGVHWFTDIIGGLLLSAALVMLYRSAAACPGKKHA